MLPPSDPARYENNSHEWVTYDGTRLSMSRYVRIQQDMRGFHMSGPNIRLSNVSE